MLFPFSAAGSILHNGSDSLESGARCVRTSDLDPNAWGPSLLGVAWGDQSIMASDLITHAKRENFARPRRGHTAKAQSATRCPCINLFKQVRRSLARRSGLPPSRKPQRDCQNKVDARLINRDSHVPRVQNNAPPRHPDNRLNHLLCTQVSTR
jgi:hypothetical protein